MQNQPSVSETDDDNDSNSDNAADNNNNNEKSFANGKYGIACSPREKQPTTNIRVYVYKARTEWKIRCALK